VGENPGGIMPEARTDLLFAGPPELALARFEEALAARTADLGLRMTPPHPAPEDALLLLTGGGLALRIDFHPAPLPAEAFAGALEGPLSRAFAGVLSDTLARHDCRLTVQVTVQVSEGRTARGAGAFATEPSGSGSQEGDSQEGAAAGIPPAPAPEEPAALLRRLRLLHAATAILAERHMPGAVFWQQSNQLLTGAQYLSISRTSTPWALFAQARITTLHPEPGEDGATRHALELKEAAQFIGRPVGFRPTPHPPEELHAAALSFLRHAVESGSPIPDGHSFGPRGGRPYRVRHLPAGPQAPRGRIELSVIGSGEDGAPAPDRTARRSGATGSGGNGPGGGHRAAALPPLAPPEEERTRSLAIGILMLAVLPPVGALLMLSNALFGSDSRRTGLLATAALGGAILLGALTFLGMPGEETASLADLPAPPLLSASAAAAD